MQPHDTKIRKFRMQTRWPHQRSEGTRGNRGWLTSSDDRRTEPVYRSATIGHIGNTSRGWDEES